MRWNGNWTSRSNVFSLDWSCLHVHHKLMLLISTFIASLSQRQRKKSSSDTAMSTSSYLHCIGKECCICFPNSGGYTYLLPPDIIARSRWICVYLSCLSVKRLCHHLPSSIFLLSSTSPTCQLSSILVKEAFWSYHDMFYKQFSKFTTNNAYNSFYHCRRVSYPFHDKLPHMFDIIWNKKRSNIEVWSDSSLVIIYLEVWFRCLIQRKNTHSNHFWIFNFLR